MRLTAGAITNAMPQHTPASSHSCQVRLFASLPRSHTKAYRRFLRLPPTRRTAWTSGYAWDEQTPMRRSQPVSRQRWATSPSPCSCVRTVASILSLSRLGKKLTVG